MTLKQQDRWLSLLCFAGFVGQVVIFTLGDWRDRIERDFTAEVAANVSTARDLSYPVLAQQPRLAGLLVGLVIFGIGALLISSAGDPSPA